MTVLPAEAMNGFLDLDRAIFAFAKTGYVAPLRVVEPLRVSPRLHRLRSGLPAPFARGLRLVW
jgi:hypothetical protein